MTTQFSSNSTTNANHNNNHNHHHHHNQQILNSNSSTLECKSKYDAEFRRFGLNRYAVGRFDDFYALLERLHGLCGIQFNIYYTDKDGELLPINNDNNLGRVLQVTMGILRLIIFRKGECYPDHHQATIGGNQVVGVNYSNANSVNTSVTPSYRAVNLINHIKELSTTLTSSSQPAAKPFLISYPEDFRPVSAIIDVDILPDTYRRVRLHKHKSSKPLGFYIRDGRSLRVTPSGVEQVPGIFISRLMPGGLAESTGLLSVNDEVIEVNGIEVNGKTLDQVTDMMVANSSNLIITVKPTNQKYNLNRSVNQSGSGSMGGLSKMNNSSLMMSKQSSMRKVGGDVSKMSTKSNDAVVVHSSGGMNNNGSSMTSSSSVNSSFSSSNQTANRHSFKNTNGAIKSPPHQAQSTKASSSAGVNQSLVDNEQIKLDLKSSLSSTKTPHHENSRGEEEDEQSEEDDDDDDDDDEEIHDVTGNNANSTQNSPDNSNSDDKILTL